MNLKEILVDSFWYSVSDWKKLILLGILLVLMDSEGGFSGSLTMNWLNAIILLFILVLGVLEAGYLFRVLEESVEGSKKLPKLNRFREMTVHGIKELLILTIYFAVPSFLFIMLLWSTEASADATIIGFLILILLLGTIYIFFPAVMLNMAHNHGNIRSGLDFRAIIRKIKYLGFKDLVVVYTGIFLILGILKLVLTDNLSTLPLVGDLVSQLIIAPFILLFTTRVLGLMDRGEDSFNH
ncbi:DUF4013 domain-containing protein [Methanobacterium aggregans]|uniref:DUF4013 domain-containing protein n=1 Tax=Methanobacterium aggregans TaxID=1615586 RepID=UPI001AE8263A|nr:DUF4013 domain-containing protein [Methanobacterium aggregans]MBP2045782.1 putative membrane protein [Methanobacterium aggregans]